MTLPRVSLLIADNIENNVFALPRRELTCTDPELGGASKPAASGQAAAASSMHQSSSSAPTIRSKVAVERKCFAFTSTDETCVKAVANFMPCWWIDPFSVWQAHRSYQDVPVTQMRKIIAKRLLESKLQLPHSYM
jgi:pyruvate/2-oxoglutarate dehydrogenase complex dihydrolipoamide acyltransferase (E2) component